MTASREPAAQHEEADARWPAAVLWDMDGTLVDTEPYWIAAEYALIEEYGGTWSDEHAMNLVGSDLIDSGRYLREHSGINLEPAEIVEELLDRVVVRMGEQIPWRDGAVELLDSLREDGTPCALVTMSYRRFVTPMGYGKTDAVADNTTREGRTQNRRVDVKMIINRGMNQQPATSSSQPVRP